MAMSLQKNHWKDDDPWLKRINEKMDCSLIFLPMGLLAHYLALNLSLKICYVLKSLAVGNLKRNTIREQNVG